MKAEVYLRSGNIINLDNVTHQEKNDLECGLDTQTNYNHRIYVGEWVFDGRSVDAVRFIEEVEE